MDGMRSVRGFHLERAAASVLTACLAVIDRRCFGYLLPNFTFIVMMLFIFQVPVSGLSPGQLAAAAVHREGGEGSDEGGGGAAKQEEEDGKVVGYARVSFM